MQLSKNPIFLRHKMQIEEALFQTPEPARTVGQSLYDTMVSSAEILDGALAPGSGERPTPQSVQVKRDEFHKNCKSLGEWLTKHAPNVILSWD
jgi:hypothetical protein